MGGRVKFGLFGFFWLFEGCLGFFLGRGEGREGLGGGGVVFFFSLRILRFFLRI